VTGGRLGRLMTDYLQRATIPSSHTPAMFRITRGHHVQHIRFPHPVMRDLDDINEEAAREDAPPADTSAPVASLEGTAEADSSTDAPQ
jgi:hypothetical protein